MSDTQLTTIPLTGKYSRGQSTVVDPDVYVWAKFFPWYVTANGYVSLNCGRTTLVLHRILVEPPAGMDVDHVNGDRLDNRRCNLRVATRSQNSANRRSGKPRTVSNYKGARRGKKGNWYAQITANYKCHYLGSFGTEEEAALAYDAAAIRLFGAFASPNFPVTKHGQVAPVD